MIERKRGRPEKEAKRDARLIVRLTPEEYGRVVQETNITGETYSDVVRKALRVYYQLRKT